MAVYTNPPYENDPSSDQDDSEVNLQSTCCTTKEKRPYSCHPPRLTIPFISLIQVCVYLCYFHNGYEDNLLYESSLVYDRKRRYEVWRYVTYMLMHKGLSHLAINISIQLVVGILLEMVQKWWYVCTVYFSGVLVGSLVHSVANPSNFLMGASAGVWALAGANVVMAMEALVDSESTPIQEQQDGWCPPKWIVTHVRKLKKLNKTNGLFILALSIMLAFVGLTIHNLVGLHDSNDTANEAHIGGCVAGLLIGVAFLELKDRTNKKRLRFSILIVFIAAITVMIVLNLAN